MSRPRVAVIGAGWAGLAAAVELAGFAELTLFEAGREPGGRARRVREAELALDNGQHILIGAYRECLRLMARVGVDPDAVLLRQPMNWHRHGGLRLHCPPLPAPLHVAWGLLAARGIGWRDKWRLSRALETLKRQGWRLAEDCTVADWLAVHDQSTALVGGFWRPLVLSALNTPLADASMQILANVLKDSLGAARADSDLLLPRHDLSALFPQPAWHWLAGQGAQLRAGCRVRDVAFADGAAWVDGERFDAAIVAVAPHHAGALLDDAALRQRLQLLRYRPICTVYLRFGQSLRLPRVMTGFAGGTADWLFDREALSGERGLVAAVISAPDEAILALPPAQLVARVLDDLRRLQPTLPEPLWSRVLVERRATFAAVAGLARPGTRIGVQCGYLAGDWVDSPYPATLEAAVQSGVNAAHVFKQDWMKQKN
ncbi:hydroxysqualene dehydroxylase HpnE [Pseudogulbenkiania sp. MAI-1]|uniref:hydroxysqualene dehydroxylase HpnE n=1 Tax=Pseudogulbenkiania sp. MAI-1 TaxID=990370 RepID=UPI00045E7C3C|nr:hydroxysqualene dehydroxylase HpnE [Pseudogulbenkiania sp. MAI-1]